jgi:hypothetical protein
MKLIDQHVKRILICIVLNIKRLSHNICSYYVQTKITSLRTAIKCNVEVLKRVAHLQIEYFIIKPVM